MGCVQFLSFKQKHHDVYEAYIASRFDGGLPQNNVCKRLYYIALDDLGEHLGFHRHLLALKHAYEASGIKASCELTGTVVGIIVSSPNNSYTKTFLKKTIYAMNSMGVSFPGHPAIEILPDFVNFSVRSRAEKCSVRETFEHQVNALLERLADYRPLAKECFNILALHAGHLKMSTTLHLWQDVKNGLTERIADEPVYIEEIHVDEGNIVDCYGCPFETCLYHGVEKRCYYGGAVVETLYPALEKADLVVWICPNYNDAVSAKLMAVINRMTALYRQVSFSDKYISAIIVSGNSGGDAVAGQLIGALSVNKGFRLWPKFALEVLANHPSELSEQKSLPETIEYYVNSMYKSIHKNIKNM